MRKISFLNQTYDSIVYIRSIGLWSAQTRQHYKSNLSNTQDGGDQAKMAKALGKEALHCEIGQIFVQIVGGKSLFDDRN